MNISDVFVEKKFPKGAKYYQVEYRPTINDTYICVGFASIEAEKKYLDLFCNNRPYILTNQIAKKDICLLDNLS